MRTYQWERWLKREPASKASPGAEQRKEKQYKKHKYEKTLIKKKLDTRSKCPRYRA